MNLRPLRPALFGVLCLAVAACSSSSTPKVGTDPGKRDKSAPVEIGAPLFPEAPWPALAEDAGAAGDPVRVPLCHLTVLDKVDLPSREEGTVEWYGVEIKPGEKAPPAELHKHGRGPDAKQYRRLRLGEKVKKGQVVALLDDERAYLEHLISISNIEGAKEELKAAAEGIKHYQANLDIEIKAGTSKSNIVAAQANLARAIAEQATKEWGVKRAEGEEKKAQEKLRNHSIRAPFDGEVVVFQKQVGEGVRATEPIMQIQNADRLGVEGYLEVQYAGKVAKGDEVFLEPALLEPPLPVRSPHASSKPITAVAVGERGGKPVVVSASEDGSVHAWDAKEVYASWKHTGPVRAVACTRPGVKPATALTGCDDGKARLWRIDDAGKEPAVVLDGHHEGGVQAATFSPDGRQCVTADDRGDLFLWDATSGKKIYTFPREHTSTVTSLQFTPQCRVVSAGRDGLALVWAVGDKSARAEMTFDHRSGEVAHLGVSDDGRQMLLDLDKARLRVIDLKGGRNLGTLQQAGETKFAGFALLSPEIGKAGRVILTAGGAEGVLQLWRWSGGAGRGSELKKLVCTGYVPATCAAFGPAEGGFVVAGTRRGDVYLWPMPTADELAHSYTATVTHVDPNVESSGKSVRVFAEYKNAAPDQPRLRPGTTVTVVIPQSQK
jgi:WD40 repeat protein/biotin carboxyl carrier protein